MLCLGSVKKEARSPERQSAMEVDDDRGHHRSEVKVKEEKVKKSDRKDREASKAAKVSILGRVRGCCPLMSRV